MLRYLRKHKFVEKELMRAKVSREAIEEGLVRLQLAAMRHGKNASSSGGEERISD